MSETVHYKGHLKKLYKLKKETLEQQCKRLCELCGDSKLDDFYDSYKEQLRYEHYEDYFIHKGDVYQIHSNKVSLDESLFLAKQTSDDRIVFDLIYYNGGCGFEEALNEALEKMV